MIHRWMLRPESDTIKCGFCGEERSSYSIAPSNNCPGVRKEKGNEEKRQKWQG